MKRNLANWEQISKDCGNRRYFRPFIPLLGAFIAGIVFGDQFSGHHAIGICLVLMCLASILAAVILRKNAKFFPIVLFFSIGYLSIQYYSAPTLPDSHINNFAADRRTRTISGRILSEPEYENLRVKCIIKVFSISDKKRTFPATGLLRVSIHKGKTDIGLPDIQIHDNIVLNSRIRKTRNFSNPGGFDYERYMAFKKIFNTAYVRSDKVRILKKRLDNNNLLSVPNFRRAFSKHIDEYAQGFSNSVLKALIIGYKKSIILDTRELFAKAGVSHLLAISGLHIGIVAGFFFLIFRWMLPWFTPVLWRAFTRKGAAFLSFFPVLFYGLIAGMSPSTQRAVMMVGVFMIGLLLDKDQNLINTLAVCAMLILAVFPPALFSLSFQLTFMAVLSIIMGMQGIKKTVINGKYFIVNAVSGKIFMSIMVTTYAVLGTLPLMMFCFNQMSWIGIITNLIFIPTIGCVAVPLGLIATFLYPVFPDLSGYFIILASWVLNTCFPLLEFFSKWPWTDITTITPSLLEIICYYTLLVSVLNIGIITRCGTNNSDSLFSKKTSCLLMAIAVLVFTVDVAYWTWYRYYRNDLKITVLDVGQGSCALVEFPKGHTMLIDGGGFYDHSIFDVGRNIVAPFLWRKKILTIDTMVLSHPDSDHMNGLLYIAEHFHVNQLWSNNESEDSYNYKKLIETAKSKKIQMPAYRDIKKKHDIFGAEAEILYPPVDFLEKKKWQKWRNNNNNSMVIRVSYGQWSFLFPGDLMEMGEKELVAMAGQRLESNVLIAPHHGSKTSSSDLFLDHVKPEYIAISSRWSSRVFSYKSVLKRYKERSYKVNITSKNGAVMMAADGKNLTIKTAK
ncbi:DNA internalization-related competence protein ComEC/Rec2 [Desulfobacterales bacterium HSG16]|nr:DNA internalization-related competence protein ComEC/Rec2 [Desulfobacterales bacterium HSG16]